MNKKMLLTVFILLAVILFIYILVLFSKKESIYFTLDSNKVSNPSRGFYKQISSRKPEKIEKVEEDIRILFLEYDIQEFKAQPISEEKLQELENFLIKAQEHGKKIIVRAAYGFSSEVKNNEVESIERIEGHILQIAPILNRYKANLLCVQAGFLGPWGEWHSSALLMDQSSQEQEKIRIRVLQALLNNLDSSIIINVRTPEFLREAQRAGLETERLGFHNDGLLASDTDLGTYPREERMTELSWCSEQITTPVNGGEMPKMSEFSEPENANNEFSYLKTTYLNKFYNEEVLHNWNTQMLDGQNAYDVLENKLGYRFWVKEIKLPQKLSIPWFPIFSFSVHMYNEGAAAIEQGYIMELILKDASGERFVFEQKDWKLGELGGGNNQQFSSTAAIPFSARLQEYSIGIRIRDKDMEDMLKAMGKEEAYWKQIEYYAVQLMSKEIVYEEGINWVYSSKG